jgi:hypothetical protein
MYSTKDIIIAVIVFAILFYFGYEKGEPRDPCFMRSGKTRCNQAPGCIYKGIEPFGTCKTNINNDLK